MSQRWEFGAEYQALNDVMRKARRERDDATIARIKPRLDELNAMIWQTVVKGFPELVTYSSLVEALEKICIKNDMPFPDLNDRERNYTGKGDWRESNRFLFAVSNKKRSVQIFPFEDRGYIDIELYEGDICYKSQTTSLNEVAIVFSKWYMQEYSIKELHKQFEWILEEPLQLHGKRTTYK